MLDALQRLDRYNLVIRTAAAVLVLAGGIIHLRLDTSWPNNNVELMWRLNFAGSVAIAIALVVWRHWLPVLAGLGLVNGTLVAFGLSRTETGIPFTDVGGQNFLEIRWNPSPEAALSVVVEIAAAVLLVVLIPAAIPKNTGDP